MLAICGGSVNDIADPIDRVFFFSVYGIVSEGKSIYLKLAVSHMTHTDGCHGTNFRPSHWWMCVESLSQALVACLSLSSLLVVANRAGWVRPDGSRLDELYADLPYQQRWTYWHAGIHNLVVAAGCLLWCPETLTPALLKRKAVAYRKRSGDNRFHATSEANNVKKAIKKAIMLPPKFLVYEPFCQLGTVYLSVAFFVIFGCQFSSLCKARLVRH